MKAEKEKKKRKENDEGMEKKKKRKMDFFPDKARNSREKDDSNEKRCR